MNRQIVHLFALFVLLFAVLVAFTSRWAVFEAESLEENTANRRPLLEQQRIPRGLILARDGTTLARDRGEGPRQARRYVRTYPQGELFSHAVGYSFIESGRAGLEKSRNDQLTGLDDEFSSIADELAGRTPEGEDLRTTLDPEAQRAALAALAGRRGSVVAIEPDTGRIRAMASVPAFDPNEVPERLSRLNRQPDSPLFNRATQARYPPGSTFKVVTAAAALDSGRFTPDSIVDGSTGQEIGGVPLQNFGGQDFGPIPLTTALTNSVNTVWAQVGESLGQRTLFRYMDRFGFGEDPPLDYPAEQLTPSGLFDGGRLLGDDDPVDVGRTAIGQERLQVAPLQMAMVAAAIANGGRLMRPRLVERVIARDGRVTERIQPRVAARVVRPDTASAVAAMMSRVVEEGSGTAAALSGTPVAGKTGTAEVEGGAANQAWFIGFAPLVNPRVAVAVTVERTQGTGGTVAGPVARQVMQELFGSG